MLITKAQHNCDLFRFGKARNVIIAHQENVEWEIVTVGNCPSGKLSGHLREDLCEFYCVKYKEMVSYLPKYGHLTPACTRIVHTYEKSVREHEVYVRVCVGVLECSNSRGKCLLLVLRLYVK